MILLDAALAALARLRVDERGQGLIEYALILGLIALVSVAAAHFLGGRVTDEFSTVGSSL